MVRPGRGLFGDWRGKGFGGGHSTAHLIRAESRAFKERAHGGARHRRGGGAAGGIAGLFSAAECAGLSDRDDSSRFFGGDASSAGGLASGGAGGLARAGGPSSWRNETGVSGLGRAGLGVASVPEARGG